MNGHAFLTLAQDNSYKISDEAFLLLLKRQPLLSRSSHPTLSEQFSVSTLLPGWQISSSIARHLQDPVIMQECRFS